MFYSILPLFAGVILYGMSIITLRGYQYFYRDHWQNFSEWLARFELWIYQLIMMGMGLGLALCSTAYPVYRLRGKCTSKSSQTPVHVDSHSVPKCTMVKSSSTSTDQHSHSATQHPTGLKLLLETIANDALFKMFIEHLVKEFNTESLLFLVELVQIKHALQLKYGNNIEIFRNPFTNMVYTDDFFRATVTYFVSNDTHRELRVSLPEDIATCDLLHRHNKFEDQLIELYHKYITEDSIHQLNISYEVRQDLDTYFKELFKNHENGKHSKQDGNEYDGFRLFDQCAIEIINLLLDPFIRFKSTTAYEEHITANIENESSERASDVKQIESEHKQMESEQMETPKTPFLQSMGVESAYNTTTVLQRTGSITTIIE